MQICTLPQTDNHANIPSLSFLQAGCPSCRPTNSVKALVEITMKNKSLTRGHHQQQLCLATSWNLSVETPMQSTPCNTASDLD